MLAVPGERRSLPVREPREEGTPFYSGSAVWTQSVRAAPPVPFLPRACFSRCAGGENGVQSLQETFAFLSRDGRKGRKRDMAVIRCKMCGGDLRLLEGSSVCECEYCGRKQTVPKADDEKKLTLFTRAGRLLRSCEFDKAAGVFETLVADFPEEAEAYWGLVLCRYGIEYVDDPATGRKIPTCHRSSFESVEDDPNYEQACENADAVARRLYREEAREIEALRSRILEVSGKEEPYDVFISYKELDGNGERTPDSVIAQEICRALTKEGLRVFFSRISLEGKLGVEYEPYIFAALNSAKVMIVVGTDYEYFNAVWVKNEWSRFLKLIAAGQAKTVIPVYRDMDPYDMPKELRTLAAQNMGKIGAMQDLVHGVEKLLGKSGAPAKEPAAVQQGGGPNVAALLERGSLSLEDGDWGKAQELFDQVLNTAPRSAEAYLGLAMAEGKYRDRDALQQAFTAPGAGIRKDRHLARARQFGGEELKAWFAQLDAAAEKADREAAEKARAEKTLKEITARADAAFKRMESAQKTEKTEFPAPDPVALAREADGSGMLKALTDEELRELLSDLAGEPVTLLSARQYWTDRETESADPAFLKKLTEGLYQCESADRAASAAAERLRQLIRDRIAAEEKKEAEAKARAREWDAHVTETLRERLKEAMEAAEQAEKEAAEQAKKAAEAREAEYRRQFADWERRRADFERAEAEAQEHQESLREKIRRLERERDGLSGLFTGKKRKELQGTIDSLHRDLKQIRFPADPGPAPARAEAGAARDTGAGAADGGIRLREKVMRSLLRSKLKKAKRGDEIRFGAYPAEKGKEKAPIEWEVLAVEQGRLLVISKYGLDAKAYNTEFTEITWGGCSLRQWLNGEFLKSAFSEAEQGMIPTVRVSADKGRYSTDPGRDTEDKVFLLSYPEAQKYFASEAERQCEPTAYAKANGCTVNPDDGFCWWWLRSPGNSSDIAADVGADGSFYGGYVYSDSGAARPALWIDPES